MTAGPAPVVSPRVLLLTTRLDFATDFVVAALRDLHVAYLRLNSEDLAASEVALFPHGPRLEVRGPAGEFSVDPEELRGVFFRRPVYLRETGEGSGLERLARSHWGVLLRSLMVFDRARWINHPVQVYAAEHKALQLAAAARVGLPVPETVVTNAGRFIPAAFELAVKGLDAVIFPDQGQEHFGYTRLVSHEALSREDLSQLPAIVQQAVAPKRDLRVTIVGQEMWCAEVVGQTGRIAGDWREMKDQVRYEPRELPADTAGRLLLLMGELGLLYGAVDLAECNGKMVFLEVNPTGEWGWLERDVGFPVSVALARLLSA